MATSPRSPIPYDSARPWLSHKYDPTMRKPPDDRRDALRHADLVPVEWGWSGRTASGDDDDQSDGPGESASGPCGAGRARQPRGVDAGRVGAHRRRSDAAHAERRRTHAAARWRRL